MTKKKYNIIRHIDNEWLNVEEAEKIYNAKFVGEFCLKNTQGGWANFPVSVFYQEEPPEPEFSNYFGLYYCPIREGVMITDAKVVAEKSFAGVVLKNGVDIIYSRYRHDYVTGSEGEMIDGGRDYLRCRVPPPAYNVSLQIIDGEIEVINDK
jgi:hypothetical protein